MGPHWSCGGHFMRVHRRAGTAVACCAILTLVLAGCVSGRKTRSNPTQNAAAKKVSLTISANDVAGGKNDAEAEWITKTVIPGFVAMEKSKGVDAGVRFNGSGVDDEKYK